MRWMVTRYFFDGPFNPGVWDEEVEGVWKEKPSDIEQYNTSWED